MPYANSHGVRIHYQIEGAGPVSATLRPMLALVCYHYHVLVMPAQTVC